MPITPEGETLSIIILFTNVSKTEQIKPVILVKLNYIKPKYCLNVIVSGGISSGEKSEMYIVEDKRTVDGDYYQVIFYRLLQMSA